MVIFSVRYMITGLNGMLFCVSSKSFYYCLQLSGFHLLLMVNDLLNAAQPAQQPLFSVEKIGQAILNGKGDV